MFKSLLDSRGPVIARLAIVMNVAAGPLVTTTGRNFLVRLNRQVNPVVVYVQRAYLRAVRPKQIVPLQPLPSESPLK